MYQNNRVKHSVIWLFVISQFFLPLYQIADGIGILRAQDMPSAGVPVEPVVYEPPATLSIWNRSSSHTAETQSVAARSDVVATSAPAITLPPTSAEPFTPVAPAPDLVFVSGTNFDQARFPSDWAFQPSWHVMALPDRSGYAARVLHQGGPVSYTGGLLNNAVLQSRILLEEGAIALSLRANDQNRYQVVVHETGQIDLYRSAVLIQSATIEFLPGDWHTLLMSVIDSEIGVSVDGTQVIDYTDPQALPAGTVELMSSSGRESRFWLEDLSLWTKPGEQAAPLEIENEIVESELLPQSESLLSIGPSYRLAAIDCRTGCSIVVRNTDGTTTTLVPDAGAPSTHNDDTVLAAWSPNGKRMAYVRQVYGEVSGHSVVVSQELHVIDVPDDNTPATHDILLVSGNKFDYCPTWSPDSKYLAFAYGNPGSSNGDYGIYRIAANGTEAQPTLIVGLGTNLGICPQWSPNSDWIAYHSVDGDQTDLKLIHAFNYAIQPLITIDEVRSSPRWSPDGSKLAFTGIADADGPYQPYGGVFGGLYVLRANTCSITLGECGLE